MPREKRFVVEDVLAKAVRRFSTHGYHATSIGDLEDCMGIHRASIYATFGSKRGLFVSALRYYIKFSTAARFGEAAAQTPTASVAIMGVVEGATNNGGFIIRAAVEMAARDDEIGRIMAEVYRETEHFFSTLIERGQSSGEISAGVDPVHVGRALFGLCLSFCVVGKPAPLQQVEALLAVASRCCPEYSHPDESRALPDRSGWPPSVIVDQVHIYRFASDETRSRDRAERPGSRMRTGRTRKGKG